MLDDPIAYSLAEHPDPHRDSASLGTLLYALFMPAIAWAGDLILDYALVGHACYPAGNQLGNPLPGLRWVHQGTLIFHLVALVLIASGILVSYYCWRRTGPRGGHAHDLLEHGEGRTRYLALVGLGFGAMFFVITATEAVSHALIALCTY